MKILFFTYDLPYPLDSGGKIRAHHLIRGLAKKHQVTLFSFYREKKQLHYLPEIKKICSQIKVFKRRSLLSPVNLPFSLVFPFPAALYYSPLVKKQIELEFRSQPYDLAHFESFYTSLYLDRKLELPQILGTENIEWRVYLTYAKTQKMPLFREAMILEALRMRRFEETTWKKADVCLATSKENAQEIESKTKKKCYLIPNGVDLEYFKFNKITRSQDNKITILFIGNFKYIQNQDAVFFLITEIFPLIKKKIKKAKLLIAGRNPTRKIKNLAAEDILIRGEVEDIRKAYPQADVLLAPIRAGSGTKFKILEAMASGIPVVTTTVGSEGIEGVEGEEILIRETPEELAWATIELMENKGLRRKLAINARKLVEEKYSWEKIVKELERVYQKI